MAEGAAAVSMAGVLSSITEVFTAATGWVGTVGSVVTSTPILMVGVVVSFVGVGIGLFSRLLRM